MKRKTKRIFSCIAIVVLLCSMIFPCSAFVSDIEDSLVLNYMYGSVDNTFTEYYQYIKDTVPYGCSNTELNAPLSKRGIVPNYFFHQFNITSSNGLPVAEGGKKWKFAISNYYEYINVDLDTSVGGIHYLQSVGKGQVSFKYSSGYWSGVIDIPNVKFVFDSNTNRCTVSFEISPSQKLDIQEIQFKYFCDFSDFGLPKLTSNDELSEYLYTIGFDNLIISREEVFPTADSSAFDDYHNAEAGLLDDAGGGLLEAGDTFNHLSSYLAPTGSFFKGTLFVGNLLGDLIGRVPFLNDLLQISLALGLLMVVLGGVMFSLGAGGGRGKKNASKGSGASKSGSSGSKGG